MPGRSLTCETQPASTGPFFLFFLQQEVRTPANTYRKGKERGRICSTKRCGSRNCTNVFQRGDGYPHVT